MVLNRTWRRLIPVSAACSLFLTASSGAPCLAQADSQAPTATASAAPATATQSGAPLQAGAQVVVLTLADLRDVGVDLNHLKSAASHLYDECTMQQVTIQTMPELIGPGTIINLPVSTMPTGNYIPPRPKRVTAAMAELRPIVDLLKSDVDEFDSGEKQLELPGDLKSQLQDELQQWVVSVTNIYGQMQILEPLSATQPYNQAAMAQATWAIVEDTKQLENLRRDIYRALQREGKRKSRR